MRKSRKRRQVQFRNRDSWRYKNSSLLGSRRPEHKDERSLQAFRYPLGTRVISLLNLPCSISRSLQCNDDCPSPARSPVMSL